MTRISTFTGRALDSPPALDGHVPGSRPATREVAEALGLPFLEDLASRPASPEFVEKVPIGFARQHGLLGLANGANDTGGPTGTSRMPVALGDVSAWGQLQVLSRFLGRPVEPMLAPPDSVAAAINAAYQQRTGQAQTFIERLDPGGLTQDLERLRASGTIRGGKDDLLDVDGRAPVVKLVSLVLFEAVQARASDVHLQPHEEALVVRFRIDGVLHNAFRLPKRLQEEILSRVKVMARMNIAEKRLPQDGRATVQVGDRVIDLRIATLPTSFGERLVVRLLDKSTRLYDLRELGMDPAALERFRRLIRFDHGLILVTGPTGSGKTTTLYAALQEINGNERNILTLEDPIEYQLEGVSQTQVSEKKGMTFASGLRSVLRQDPDVIMIGEIRDRETAVMAIQSALTGHLVFSTLHTNDAASAVARLLDLGIEPYLLASSMIGVLAQRLVRKLCPDCAAPAGAPDGAPTASPSQATSRDRTPCHPERSEGSLPAPEAPEILRCAQDDERFRAREYAARALANSASKANMAVGCPACRQTGYRGRLGIFELLMVDDVVRRQIQARATASEINAAVRAAGMHTLRDDGIAKVSAGLTSREDVLRVTMQLDVGLA